MLTEKMTYEEMYRELLEDFVNVERWCFHRGPSLRRTSLHARTFPQIVRHTYTSPRKNDWTIIFVIKSKFRNVQDIYNIVFTKLRTSQGDYYLLLHPDVDKKLRVLVYLPHFMKRYKARTDQSLVGAPLAERYFLLNDCGTFVDAPDEEFKRCLCTLEGIVLGEDLNNRMYLCKTFIRYDMSKGWQREAFENARKKNPLPFSGGVTVVSGKESVSATITQTCKEQPKKHIF